MTASYHGAMRVTRYDDPVSFRPRSFDYRFHEPGALTAATGRDG